MTYHTRLIVSLLVVVGATSALADDDKSTFLTRSIYVPVEFQLCEHLDNAVLYQGEEAVGVVPAKRIFQFTFYPGLRRIEPTKADVRVEGTRTNGEKFTGRLAVTPWGIVTADEEIELDLEKQLARMKHKLDVRYESRVLVLRCSDACRRETKTEAVATAAASTSSN